MSIYLVYTLGGMAQVLFSARILIQWIASEKACKVLSPTLFWQLSLIASFLLFIYGWLRDDFAIILGQFIAYYIYIWNLKVKDSWKQIPRSMRFLFLFLPILLITPFLFDGQTTINRLFSGRNIPVGLLIWGIAGQCTFTLRFVYQWLYSRKVGESVLPMAFWIISLTGSLMIIIYAILRNDPILIVGQTTGFIAYTRNIMIGMKARKLQT